MKRGWDSHGFSMKWGLPKWDQRKIEVFLRETISPWGCKWFLKIVVGWCPLWKRWCKSTCFFVLEKRYYCTYSNYPWRIQSYGIYMLTWLGYIDGKCYHIWHTYGSYGLQWCLLIITCWNLSRVAGLTNINHVSVNIPQVHRHYPIATSIEDLP